MMIHGREFPIATSDPFNKTHFKLVEWIKNKPKGKILDFPAGLADYRGCSTMKDLM